MPRRPVKAHESVRGLRKVAEGQTAPFEKDDIEPISVDAVAYQTELACESRKFIKAISRCLIRFGFAICHVCRSNDRAMSRRLWVARREHPRSSRSAQSPGQTTACERVKS